MITKLPEEFHQAIANRPGQAIEVEDAVTHARYILMPLDVYERLKQAAAYDTSEPDPRAFYPTFAHAVKDELDAPGMARYEEDDTPHTQP